MNAAVDAPGDAPSSATIDLSAAATISVPNWSVPSLCLNQPWLSCGLIVSTRWPATLSRQSFFFARGKYC